MLPQFIRKVISKSLTISDWFHFYQFLVKFLKGLFLIHLNFFMKIICLMRINQDSDHLIHVNISSCQLYMIYIYIYIYIYASFDCNPPCDVRGIIKLLMGCGMRYLSIKLNVLVLRVYHWNLLKFF